MTYMLCHNRLKDFARWKAVFDAHAEAHGESGLKLTKLWRDVKDPNSVFFLLEVADVDNALAFINSPHSAKAGQEAGVIDGYYHFVEDVPGS